MSETPNVSLSGASDREAKERQRVFTEGWACGYRAGYAEALRRVHADVIARDKSPQIPYFDARLDYERHGGPLKAEHITTPEDVEQDTYSGRGRS